MKRINLNLGSLKIAWSERRDLAIKLLKENKAGVGDYVKGNPFDSKGGFVLEANKDKFIIGRFNSIFGITVSTFSSNYGVDTMNEHSLLYEEYKKIIEKSTREMYNRKWLK